MSPRARQTKSKARVSAYNQLVADAEAAERAVTDKLGDLHPPPGPRLGDVVVPEASEVIKGFGDQLLIEDLSFTPSARGIVGVIGPNGAGKTTALFRMMHRLEEAPEATGRSGSATRYGPSLSAGQMTRATLSAAEGHRVRGVAEEAEDASW